MRWPGFKDPTGGVEHHVDFVHFAWLKRRWILVRVAMGQIEDAFGHQGCAAIRRDIDQAGHDKGNIRVRCYMQHCLGIAQEFRLAQLRPRSAQLSE